MRLLNKLTASGSRGLLLVRGLEHRAQHLNEVCEGLEAEAVVSLELSRRQRVKVVLPVERRRVDPLWACGPWPPPRAALAERARAIAIATS
mgnify:CR=1 FL=1